jgi:hypothetical protein
VEAPLQGLRSAAAEKGKFERGVLEGAEMPEGIVEELEASEVHLELELDVV